MNSWRTCTRYATSLRALWGRWKTVPIWNAVPAGSPSACWPDAWHHWRVPGGLTWSHSLLRRISGSDFGACGTAGGGSPRLARGWVHLRVERLPSGATGSHRPLYSNPVILLLYVPSLLHHGPALRESSAAVERWSCSITVVVALFVAPFVGLAWLQRRLPRPRVHEGFPGDPAVPDIEVAERVARGSGRPAPRPGSTGQA